MERVERLLELATKRGDPPAAAVCVIRDGAILHESAHGGSPRGGAEEDAPHAASVAELAATTRSVFDIASVTKVVATTSAIAVLVARGEVALDASVARYLPAFAVNGKGGVTVRELLGHRSGLPAWRPFFVDVMRDARAGDVFGPAASLSGAGDAAARERSRGVGGEVGDPADEERSRRAEGEVGNRTPKERSRRADGEVGDPVARPAARAGAWERGRQIVVDGVLAAPLEAPGRRVYSDLGFIALGALIEAVAGEQLDAFCEREVWGAVGLADGAHRLGFVDLAAARSWIEGRHVLPTGRTRPREPAPGQEALYRVPPQPERPDAGRVDDDNAFAMRGVAGHAGVFGTARAVARMGAALTGELDGADRLGCGDALRTFMTIDAAGEGPPRGLGFDVPSGATSSLGTRLGRGPRGACGHLGFTGCSLWLDLDLRLSVALLTNRTYPGRDRVTGIRALRPAVHDAIADTLGLP